MEPQDSQPKAEDSAQAGASAPGGVGGLFRQILTGRTLKTRMREMESALQGALGELGALKARIEELTEYSQVMDAAPRALFWKDRHGRFLGCNRAFARAVGCEHPGQVVGKTDHDFLHTRDGAEGYRRDDQAVIESGKARPDILETLKRPDGSLAWVRTVKTPLVDAHGRVRGVLGMFEDVSEFKAGEEAAKQSGALYRGLFHALQEGFSLHEIICDERGAPRDFRYLDVNSAFERQTGVPRDKWIGKTAREILPGIEQARIDRYGEVALTGKTAVFEEFSKESGRHYSITVYCPQIRQFAVITQDITRRKEAENIERAARQRLELLVNQSPVAVIEWDLDYRVTEWNAAAERLFGFPRAEALGNVTCELIVQPKDRVHVNSVFDAIIADTSPSGVESTNENITKDGRIITCAWRNTALVDASGKIIGGASLANDVTERLRTEEERRKLDSQMQQVQKLESLGVLAGGIAHDFNNLLMAILGNADLALSELPAMSPGREHIHEIETASRRAADLCRQMLAYSGKGRFVIEVVSLSDLVGEMVHLLKTSISKKAILNLNLERNLPAFRGDVTQVRQIVMNLVINASEAIAERSGVITISTGAMECSADYLREVYVDSRIASGFYIWLEVCDTGCGMNLETQHRIFEPFFTTKFTGRGLGLSAVLGIVRGHKGGIKVYSEPGKGTSFKVLFPAAADEVAGRKTVSPDTLAWIGSGTILLVDDEETIRATGKMMLERMGYRVLSAEDGRQALEIYMRQKDAIALVLLDLTMPHMDGEETYRELRRINPSARVVMSSGYSEMDVSSRFVGKGLAGFIQKPYSRAELAQCLRAALPSAEAVPGTEL